MNNHNAIYFTATEAEVRGTECMKIKASQSKDEEGETILIMDPMKVKILDMFYDNIAIIFINQNAIAWYVSCFYDRFIEKIYGSIDTEIGKGYVVQIDEIWTDCLQDELAS